MINFPLDVPRNRVLSRRSLTKTTVTCRGSFTHNLSYKWHFRSSPFEIKKEIAKGRGGEKCRDSLFERGRGREDLKLVNGPVYRRTTPQHARAVSQSARECTCFRCARRAYCCGYKEPCTRITGADPGAYPRRRVTNHRLRFPLAAAARELPLSRNCNLQLPQLAGRMRNRTRTNARSPIWALNRERGRYRVNGFQSSRWKIKGRRYYRRSVALKSFCTKMQYALLIRP